MRASVSRRRFLNYTAAGLSMAATSPIAWAQTAVQPPPKPTKPDEYSVTAPVSIEVNARPLPSFDTSDHSHVRFGSLEYRSGLILTSSFRGFGGLSGLRLDARGERFIAISDKGSWFTGRIVYKGREMTGLADVEASPILGPDGKAITARGWFDTESLALDGSYVYVGLERVNQVLRFDFARGFTRSLGEVVPLPPAARKLPYNKGLEALVMVPKGFALAGTLIAISERGFDAGGNIIGFLIGGKTPGQFGVRRTDDFDVSDAVLLPSGDLLLLERKFSLARRRRHPDPACPDRLRRPRRRDRWPRYLQCRSRQRNRQHGRHRRPCHAGRRYRPDPGLRRQFLDDPAQSAAAVHAGWIALAQHPLSDRR